MKKRPFPRYCYRCQDTTIDQVNISYTFECYGLGTVTVHSVPVNECRTCKHIQLDLDSDAVITAAIEEIKKSKGL